MSTKDNSIEQEQQMPELEKNNQLPENESVYQKSYIRLRPGMFIGRIGDGSNPDDAIYTMLKEIVDNAVDEYLMGFGERIDITLEQGMVSARDYGRGIPLEKLVKCVTKFSPIWKADTADYAFYNIGRAGAGTKVVNALSSKFEITTWREGKCRTALFHEGELIHDKYIDPGEEKSGTLVCFIPDSKIMANYKYYLPFIEKRLHTYACLNKGLSLYLNGKHFYSPYGLLDLIKSNHVDGKYNYPSFSFYYKKPGLEFVICPVTTGSKNHFYSFVNGQYTNDGGTHLSAFRKGIKQAINLYFKKNYTLHEIQRCVWGALSLWIQDPLFETCTRSKLTNSNVQDFIWTAVIKSFLNYLDENPDKANVFLNELEKIRKTDEESLF